MLVKNESNEIETVSYNISEYALNGTLLSYVKTSVTTFPEAVISFIFLQIAHAVHHIHSNNYAHLDLKLNNILLDEFFNVWVGDFGSAMKLTKNKLSSRRRGTQRYMAPEVKNLKSGQTYDAQKADVYSLGVCLFILTFKTFPLYVEELEKKQ